MGVSVKKVTLLEISKGDDGYVITSPLLPELVIGGDTLRQVINDLPAALSATIALYEDKPLRAIALALE